MDKDEQAEMQRLIAKVEMCRPVSEQLKRLSKYNGAWYTWPTEKGDCTADDYAEWMHDDAAPGLIKYIRQLERQNKGMREGLEWFSKCESSFFGQHDEKDEWKLDFFNQVVLKPVNEKAKQLLSSLS